MFWLTIAFGFFQNLTDLADCAHVGRVHMLSFSFYSVENHFFDVVVVYTYVYNVHSAVFSSWLHPHC